MAENKDDGISWGWVVAGAAVVLATVVAVATGSGAEISSDTPVTDAVEKAKEAMENIPQAAEEAAKGVKGAAEEAAKGVKGAAEEAAKGVKEAAEEAAKGVEDAAKKAKEFVDDIKGAVEEGVGRTEPMSGEPATPEPIVIEASYGGKVVGPQGPQLHAI